MALVAGLAVTAGAVELAEIHNGEAVDGDGTLSVVLDDLVVSGLCTTTLDKSIAIALKGESVYNESVYNKSMIE